MNADERTAFRLHCMARWSFLITLGIGLVSLLGWISGLLTSDILNPDYIPMAPSTALCISLLSASSLVYVLRPERSAVRGAALAGVGLTFLIVLIILLGFFLGSNFKFENLVIRSPRLVAHSPVGRMSPITAVTFLMAALAVFLLFSAQGERSRLKQAVAIMATAIASIGFVVVVGYLYGTPLLYGGDIIPVAFLTALAFGVFGLGLMTASGPLVLPVKLFTGPTVRSRLMRAFLPAAIVFVLIDNGVLYKTTLTQSSNPALISSLIGLFSLLVVGLIISKISKAIGNEIDQAHTEQKQGAAMLALDEDRLETLLKLAQLKVNSEKELTEFALEEMVRLTKSQGGYLHFFDEDQQSLHLNSWSKEVLKTCRTTAVHHYPLEAAGVWADSIRFRRPVVHNDYQGLPDTKGYPQGHFHLVRHLGVPIFDQDRIVGVVGVGNKEEPYDERDIRQIKLFINTMWGLLKKQRSEKERERLIDELKEALDKVKTLSGMLPICASCKKIRNDEGYWESIETYIGDHSEAEFSHSLCPTCARKLYPDFLQDIIKDRNE